MSIYIYLFSCLRPITYFSDETTRIQKRPPWNIAGVSIWSITRKLSIQCRHNYTHSINFLSQSKILYANVNGCKILKDFISAIFLAESSIQNFFILPIGMSLNGVDGVRSQRRRWKRRLFQDLLIVTKWIVLQLI